MKRVGIVVALSLLSAGAVQADFQTGLNAYNNKDFGQAVSNWTEDAVRGDLNSQYNLGILFEQGVEGFPKDLAAAFGWYRLAASQNVEAALKALTRIKPLMTAGQIETGNKQAIELFGKWFRQNIGRDEKDYQAAKITLEEERQKKIEVERKAAAARAQRQRDIIAQRDADAKLAGKLQRESRAAAIKAAQEKAEEAKRRAFIERRRKEEDARLSALREEQEQQKKVATARSRLAELQAKQRGQQPQSTSQRPAVPQPVPQLEPVKPVATIPELPVQKTASEPEKMRVQDEPVKQAAPGKVQVSSAVAAPVKSESIPNKTVFPEKELKSSDDKQTKSDQSVASTPTVQTSSAPVKPLITSADDPKKAAHKKMEIEAAPVVTSVEPVIDQPKEKPVHTVSTVEKPTPKSEPVATPQKPFKAKATPSSAHVASLPAAKSKIVLPALTNGLDVMVMKQIVEKANSVPLDTAEARREIDDARTDIEALQWSLISAARGKGSAKRMNAILEEKMTDIQIAEANRRAAEWIVKRQKRQ